LNGRDWKSRNGGNLVRGFESLPLRFDGTGTRPPPEALSALPERAPKIGLIVKSRIYILPPMRMRVGEQEAPETRMFGGAWRAATAAGLVALASLLVGVAAPAASASTTTLATAGSDGRTPDSVFNTFTVAATSTEGVVSGTLSTSGKVSGDVGGTFVTFKGDVTCMYVDGDKVVVGAVGSDSTAGFGPPSPLPGEYGQLLSIELGEFPDPFTEELIIYSFKWADLGAHNEGVEGLTSPDCESPEAPSPWVLPTFGGSAELTTTSPETEGYGDRASGVVHEQSYHGTAGRAGERHKRSKRHGRPRTHHEHR
jgi:hypothetical protein